MQRLCCHMYTVVLLLWAKDAYISPATCNHAPWCCFLMPCIIASFTLAVFIHFLEWHRVVSVQTSSSEYNDLLMSLRLRCTQSRWSLSRGLQTRRLPPTRESLRKSLWRHSRQHHNQVVHQLFEQRWNWRRRRANNMRWYPNVQIDTCLLEIYLLLCTCPNEFNLKGKRYGKDLKTGQKNSSSLRCLFIYQI